jgi:Protein of unknown function (DUF1236)
VFRWFHNCRLLGVRGQKYEEPSMRSKLLITTSALLAGIAVASAQNMPGGGRDSGPAAQSQSAPSGGGAGQDRQAPQRSPGQAQQGQKEQTTGQAPQREPGAQSKDSKDNAQPQRTQRGQKEQTTGQAPQREQGAQGKDSQDKAQQSPTQAQSPQRQHGQGAQGQGQQGQDAQQGQAQQGQAGSKTTLTTEQRTKIRQTVLTGGNAPRATNVNFAVRVGTVVPTSVRVVAVPQVIIDIHPEWSGYMYFVVGDEIIIVDNGRIVAILAV